jgi:hypothetical protein
MRFLTASCSQRQFINCLYRLADYVAFWRFFFNCGAIKLGGLVAKSIARAALFIASYKIRLASSSGKIKLQWQHMECEIATALKNQNKNKHSQQ